MELSLGVGALNFSMKILWKWRPAVNMCTPAILTMTTMTATTTMTTNTKKPLLRHILLKRKITMAIAVTFMGSTQLTDTYTSQRPQHKAANTKRKQHTITTTIPQQLRLTQRQAQGTHTAHRDTST